MKKLLKKIIPDFLLSRYHWKLALLGALIYGFPSRKLKVIGVTGTKGKSTVVVLAGKILAEKFTSPPADAKAMAGKHPSPYQGEGENTNPPQPSLKGGSGSPPLGGVRGDFTSRVGWISSLSINDGQKEVMNPYHMTMPGRFFIQKTLRQMVKNDCEYALIEVTSEGIKQHRHKFIKWAGAVFTNLAAEHIEAHGSFAKYREAKIELFKAAAKNKDSFGVYNLDDENVQHFLEPNVKNKYGYSLKIQNPKSKFQIKSKIQISNIKLSASGSEFEIDGVKFKTNLLGEFNVANCAAAITMGQACGVSLETAKKALEKIKSIPGRLEIIDEGQNFTVVVDLAHTPDSFEKVFALFKSLLASSKSRILRDEGGSHDRIISVFGSAGGGRDRWKRPELGRIASQNSDILIVCNEDPYDESSEKIAREICAGCKFTKPEITLDRRQAIVRALSLAHSGDIVLILGKGTEQTMVIGGKKYEWDDREVVKEELRKIFQK
ncbi:UDP-N-acetylmuramoyl-L-alanyl-D-glutamate--2,6-diaminopimelate ligase [Patescibacteria group bacterium]|nr:UDP-N-acetylmuramoyl-L-alanyl-D-glutamate--2,6-diaminopimelate ligase [Patescibacteria group bacterium]